jgi:dephospho-CoA kinase
MLKAGITGGIGSGKTTVCQVFETLGIPVFYADLAARQLMQNDPDLKKGIIALFGDESYTDGALNRMYIGSKVFGDPQKLTQLNALTHPAVIRYGQWWMAKQKSPYVLKEAALFFESGSDKDMDVMIGVSAPLPLRMSRIRVREKLTEEQVQERIARQMDEAEKMSRCDYILVNDDRQPVIDQVLSLHHQLLQQAAAAL